MNYITIKESLCEVITHPTQLHGNYYGEPAYCRQQIIGAFGYYLMGEADYGFEYAVCPVHGIFKKNINPRSRTSLK